ncbi:MAG: hypothetical protein Q8L00_05415, partial [Deltaproteobacteria bacterium]|nr:hypothetical protein [Deltaproteobacteria bacterium]
WKRRSMRRCNCSSSPMGFHPGSLKKIGMLLLLRNMINFRSCCRLTKVNLSIAPRPVKAWGLKSSKFKVQGSRLGVA